MGKYTTQQGPSKRDQSMMALPEKSSFVQQCGICKGRDFHKLQYLKGKGILSVWFVKRPRRRINDI